MNHVEKINNYLNIAMYPGLDVEGFPSWMHDVHQYTGATEETKVIKGKVIFCIDRPVLFIMTRQLEALNKLPGFEVLNRSNTLSKGHVSAIFDNPTLQRNWDHVQMKIAYRVSTESMFIKRLNDGEEIYVPGVIHCADLDELLPDFEELAIANPDMPTEEKIEELNKLLAEGDRRFRVTSPYPLNYVGWGHWQIELIIK